MNCTGGVPSAWPANEAYWRAGWQWGKGRGGVERLASKGPWEVSWGGGWRRATVGWLAGREGPQEVGVGAY